MSSPVSVRKNGAVRIRFKSGIPIGLLSMQLRDFLRQLKHPGPPRSICSRPRIVKNDVILIKPTSKGIVPYMLTWSNIIKGIRGLY